MSSLVGIVVVFVVVSGEPVWGMIRVVPPAARQGHARSIGS
ncbi:MAG TPA: hypothetical protein VME70_08235 [Mycobacteriales bacterium]|nr:hypothetical protein [Mycobacteriales bacterium]